MKIDPLPCACACGSGLSRARCCEGYLPADAQEVAQELRAVAARAVEALRQGGTAMAETFCLHVLERAPAECDSLRVLYQIRQAGGNSRAAEALLRRLVLLEPNDFCAPGGRQVVVDERAIRRRSSRPRRPRVMRCHSRGCRRSVDRGTGKLGIEPRKVETPGR